MLPGKSYSPKDILSVAKRRLWLLPLPIVTLFGALVYSSTLPDIYQASMLISIVPQRVPDEFVRSTVTLRTEERLNAITVQIMSRSALEPMINEFDLYSAERARLPMEDIVQEMQESITVGLERPTSNQRDMGPSAFHVQFTYPDAALAARVTQRLGSIFVDQNARDRGALAKATDEFLQNQLKEARDRLEALERRMESFRERHGNELPTQLQSNLVAIQNAQLQIQALVEASARDRDRKLMLERLYQEAQNEPAVAPPVAVAAVAPAPGGDSLMQAAAGTPEQQLAAARTRLESLRTRLTPEHPDIVRTKRSIAELEAKVATARSERDAETPAPSPTSAEDAQRRERLRAMRAEIESLDRQTAFKETEEQRLRALATEYQRRIEAVPGVESEWTVLTRDYDTQQAAYKELLTKSEASKVALNLEDRQIGENFRVLDPARVPVKPVSPKRIQISAIGIILGIGLMLGIVAFLEFRDASFRTEEEVTSVLAMPVLAILPYVETDAEKTRRVWRLAGIAAAAVVVATGAAYVFWALRLWTVVV
jgi:polysaccharide chain length determinant protein (PEP-CTERM system associated)